MLLIFIENYIIFSLFIVQVQEMREERKKMEERIGSHVEMTSTLGECQ